MPASRSRPAAARARLTIAGGHALRIEAGASATWGPTNTDIDIQAPSSLVNAGTLVISNDTTVFGSGTFVNSGTLVKDSHLQTTLVAPFDNDGTVELRAGSLELQTDGGLGSTGAITLAPTTHLRTGTGAITLGPAASVTGPGTVDVISGSLIVPATATWDVGVTNIWGTLTLDGERTIASLALFGGTLAGSGTRTITGSLSLYTGTLTGSATTSVAAGASLAVAPGGGQSRLTIAGGHALRIEAGASATWGPTNTDIDIQAPSSLVNAGTLVISNDTTVFGSGTFVNSGTLVKDSHLQTTLVAPFDNDGTVELRAGSLELQTDGGLGSTGAITLAPTTHLRTGTGAITLGPAASVTGPGTVDVISGSLIVPATATWDVGVTNIWGTLTLDGERTIASLALFGGTLAGSGTRTITGSLSLYTGTLTGSATTSVAAGASLAVAPGGGQSRLTIAGGHALRIEAGASATWGPTNTDIDIQAPSSLVNAGTLVISNDTTVFGSGTFVNSGTLVKDSHLQTTLVAPFDNDGTVELRAGSLELQTDGGLGSTGAITLAPTTHLRTGTGAITLGPAASVTGPGTVDVISGSLIVPATATWDVGVTNIWGTLTLDGERTIASLALFGGTLAGSGTRTITGSLSLYTGTLTGSATTSVAAGASLAVAPGGGQSRLTIAGGHALRIEAGASATWGPTNTDIDIQAPSSLVNAGTLVISNDTTVFGSGTFVNSGTLVKDSHLQTTLVAPFDNDGTVELRAGSLEVTGEGLDNAGTLRIAAGLVVRTVSYRQSATGVLEVGLAGAGSGQLVVTTGPTTLDGTLALVAEAGSVIPATGLLVVSTTGERTGEFSQVQGLEAIGAGAQVVYGTDGVRVVSGPTP